jgi:hypothetical protein
MAKHRVDENRGSARADFDDFAYVNEAAHVGNRHGKGAEKFGPPASVLWHRCSRDTPSPAGCQMRIESQPPYMCLSLLAHGDMAENHLVWLHGHERWRAS